MTMQHIILKQRFVKRHLFHLHNTPTIYIVHHTSTCTCASTLQYMYTAMDHIIQFTSSEGIWKCDILQQD